MTLLDCAIAGCADCRAAVKHAHDICPTADKARLHDPAPHADPADNKASAVLSGSSGRVAIAAFFLAARLTLVAWGDGRVTVLPDSTARVTMQQGKCSVTPQRSKLRIPRIKVKVKLHSDGRAAL